ncbi:hypothetical protein NIIDNTM18_42450 [Mycolicibacterium litorale]|uniref:HNH nuclease domain-containing protein n=1 Tax=Mycolicibacterium litorale TaxID=758802 RepID=A0A6S6PBH0_9MYCO|nr:HNH endonuclease [Mycolicibacterium litorale]BCI54967.1 hypothetical protein NIIDNTM18_42450 [Mycolicibacterium litorale]
MSDEKDVDGERLVIRYNTKADMNRSEVAEQAVRAALKLYGIECRKPVIVLGAKPERILASDVHEVFSDGNADTKIAPGTVTAGASWELENDPGVEWRQHPEFHQYEVSDDGRVRVKARLVTPPGGKKQYWRPAREIRLHGRPGGYLGTTITPAPGAPPFQRRVHVLVCETFHGPKPARGMHVRHLNGNPLDNRAENLAWGTPSENSHDTVRHGRNKEANKTHCKYGHEFTPENTCKGPRGTRGCLECTRRRSREGARRKREALRRGNGAAA